MNISDPISDMLTRIRNAQKAGHDVVAIPASRSKIAIAHILKEEGLVKDYKCIRDKKQGVLKVALKYQENGVGAISEMKKVSTPGRRVYLDHKTIPFVRNGFGVAIISTSQGIMADRDARNLKIGGEYICSVY